MIWAIAAAGFVGAVARYLLDGIVQQRLESSLPWGTFAVNVSGSLLLGLVAGLGVYHGLDTDAELLIGTGLLGSYTTFSTYAFETYRLAEDGARRMAALNAIGSVAAGLLAAAAGLGLTAATN